MVVREQFPNDPPGIIVVAADNCAVAYDRKCPARTTYNNAHAVLTNSCSRPRWQLVFFNCSQYFIYFLSRANASPIPDCMHVNDLGNCLVVRLAGPSKHDCTQRFALTATTITSRTQICKYNGSVGRSPISSFCLRIGLDDKQGARLTVNRSLGSSEASNAPRRPT